MSLFSYSNPRTPRCQAKQVPARQARSNCQKIDKKHSTGTTKVGAWSRFYSHHLISLVRKEAPGGSRKPLVWDTALEADAIKYAKVLGTLGKMIHDIASVNKYYCGENLGEVPHHPTYNGKYRVEEFPMLRSTKYWCDEKEFYDGRVLKKDNMGISGQRGQIGHYTQVCMLSVTSE